MNVPANHYKTVIEPAMELGKKLNVKNPESEALFDVASGCINIWCTPQDHPSGAEWKQITMTAGAFAKPAEYIGMIFWERDNENRIVHIEVTSNAYILADQFPKKFVASKSHARKGVEYICNRPADLAWLKQKAIWLFEQAGVDLAKAGISISNCVETTTPTLATVH